MKIVIVGCGKVGQKIAESLSSENEHDITVIDLRSTVVNDVVNAYDVMGVVGNGASLDVLEQAGVKEADILIAVTGSDEINLLTCLIGRKTGGCKTIARVRKPEYNKEIELFKEDLGLAMVINPEQTAANEIARLLRFPSAIQIDTFAKGRVEILKFKICKDSVLCDMKLSDMGAKLKCDVLVCGVERGDDAFIPGGDFVLRAEDRLSIVASLEKCSEFFKKIGIKTNKVKDTIIVGGGEIGFYLAKQLIKTGVNVKIIEQDTARCEELFEVLPKATIINGDGTDNRLLMEEGLEQSESFVALTNIDEENILLSLFAKSKSKGKIITKINRITFDEVINSLNLDTTIQPKDITAEYIVRFVRATNNSFESNIETMHLILEGKAEALEFRIGDNSPISEKTLEELTLKDNIIIACINRNGQIITPRGKDMIKSGDTVIVVTTNRGYKDIEDILE
ncbi:MAG: Trk system potassium transporter TrkA [Clostridia bacterium]|nr:Trk system potassium transporter TrkA [Clostridia bacterium]